MLRDSLSVVSPFSLWRPLELLVEETMQEELEVKDVEFEEGCMEVAQFLVNPYQLPRSWVNPCQV